MVGLWQSLKHKLSRNHPDRTSKNFDPKGLTTESAQQTKEPIVDMKSTPVAGVNGVEREEIHRPHLEPQRDDGTQISQSMDQTIAAST